MKRLLALDPAATTGFCYGSAAPEQWGAWEIAKPGDSHPGQRLARLRECLYHVRRTWAPELIAFEESSFGSPNPDVQAMHNELRGVIRLCAYEFGVPAVGCNIASVKALAGGGRFKKREMIEAAERHFGIRAASGDVADAIWIWAFAQKYPMGKPAAKAVSKKRKVNRRKEARLF
jgi:Holliday junction resolvasome RuvABC endonuclease subunit